MHEVKKIDWITGCAFMVRTKVVEQIGPLWEALFIYHEDVDWSFCIQKAGYELVYVPKSVIYHIAGMSHKSVQKTKEGFVSPKVHYLNARNKIWFLKAHSPWYTLPTIIIYHVFYFFCIDFYFIFRRRWAKLKALNKGIWEGLTTFPQKETL
jgi:GT2 family glycosyltransferase